MSDFDISYNYLVRENLAQQETDFMDSLQPDWENTQGGNICANVSDVSVSDCEALVALAKANTGTDRNSMNGWSQAL